MLRSFLAPPVQPLLVPAVGSVRTVANIITMVRTVAVVVMGAFSIGTHRPWLLAVAYAVYWLGDLLDGVAARRLGQETRIGAVFDIVGDRVSTVLLCAGLLVVRPGAWTAVSVFLVQFAVVDTMLSLAFLCWPLLSPNYFHLVDRTVWLLNWSHPAKAANTSAVVLAVAANQFLAALVIVLVVLGVKIWSVCRVAGLLSQPHREDRLLRGERLEPISTTRRPQTAPPTRSTSPTPGP